MWVEPQAAQIVASSALLPSLPACAGHLYLRFMHLYTRPP
jgi:hypothetical protein